MHILFVAGHPGGLRLDVEARDVQQKIRERRHRDGIEVKVLPAARAQDMLDGITGFRPKVVHFSGHGGLKPPGLYLESVQGGPQLVSTKALEQLFAGVAKQARLVVLNACYSEMQARVIAKHVDCVIGMDDAIPDQDAIEFAVALYAAITDGSSVQEAFNCGKSLSAMTGKDDSIVHLFRRDGVDPATVHLLPNPR